MTKKPVWKKILRWLLAMMTVVVFVLLILIPASLKRTELKKEEDARKAELKAGPRVRVSRVTMTPGKHTLILIGETIPYQEAILFAKVSGYLRDVRVDKGDQVKKGQVLAVIESPETDQAYQAALADERNKRAIAARVQELFNRKLVSPQELDQARADEGVSLANLRTQEVYLGYKTIRAPFDGTITARFADPGALVQNATGARSGALPVVTVSEVKRLRVDVFVDQKDASFVKNNQPVIITRGETEVEKIFGKVSRIADKLDARTKMLLTEIDIPNVKHPLVAGSFVRVALKVSSPPYWVAPVDALVLIHGKPNLTEVTASDRIAFKPIEIAHNDGKVLWISAGVQEGDRIALNVGTSVPEGGKVRPIVETGQ